MNIFGQYYQTFNSHYLTFLTELDLELELDLDLDIVIHARVVSKQPREISINFKAKLHTGCCIIIKQRER